MKIKTADLAGAALDWAVAKCEGRDFCITRPDLLASGVVQPPYSTNWSQGGPIIEREKIEVTPPTPKWCDEQADNDWMAVSLPAVRGEATLEVGPTPLIAAMRCYVASKLGDEVEIPDELGDTVEIPKKLAVSWHSGVPPHVGWWNASNAKCPITWRWWNGTTWSVAAYEGNSAEQVERKARTPLEPIWCRQTDIYWSDYWPANARVPRICIKANIQSRGETA